MEKERQLELLDSALEKYLAKYGTIRESVSIAYPIRKQIENCSKVGASKREVDSILSKYEVPDQSKN